MHSIAAGVRAASNLELVEAASAVAAELARRDAPESGMAALECAEVLGGAIDVLECGLAGLVGRVDDTGVFGELGFSSTGAWLRGRLGMRDGRAAERIRLARQLPRLTRVAARMADGSLSAGYAGAVADAVARLDDADAELGEELLLGLIEEGHTAGQVARDGAQITDLINIHRGKEKEPEDSRRGFSRSWINKSRSLDGGLWLKAWLTPEHAATFDQIIGPMAKPKAKGDDRDLGQRTADALMSVISEGNKGAGVTVIIDLEAFTQATGDTGPMQFTHRPGGAKARHQGRARADHGPHHPRAGGQGGAGGGQSDDTDLGALADDPDDLEDDTDGRGFDTGPGGLGFDTSSGDSDDLDGMWDPTGDHTTGDQDPRDPSTSEHGRVDPSTGDQDPRDQDPRDPCTGEYGRDDLSIGDQTAGGQGTNDSEDDHRAGDHRAGDHRAGDQGTDATGDPPRLGNATRHRSAPDTSAGAGTATGMRDRSMPGSSAGAGTGIGNCRGTEGPRVPIGGRLPARGKRRAAARLLNGTPVSPERARQIALNAGINVLILGRSGSPLYLGRTVRFATPAQRKALLALYETCCVQGCQIPAHLCEIHHLDGGWKLATATDIDKLAPACGWHNRWVETYPDQVEQTRDAHGRATLRLLTPWERRATQAA